MDAILLYPIVLPIIAGLICLLLPKRLGFVRELLALLVPLVNLGFALAIFRQPELAFSLPWFTAGRGLEVSIDLLATPFARLILLAAPTYVFLVAIYSLEFLAGSPHRREYYAYLLASLGIASGAVLANNFIILLFFWELLGFLLYLMVMISGSEAALSAVKALVIAVIGDMCFLMGMAFLWLYTGTLTISDLIAKPLTTQAPLAMTAYLLIMIGAFAKAGVMPLHTWLPAISTQAIMPVMSLFTSLDKLVGIYLLASLTLTWFVVDPGINLLLMIVGSITLLAGVLMAMIQHDFRRMLAFHNVSQVGYMVLGIGTGTALGIIGGLFHMLNMVILKGSLFLCGGSVQRQTGRTEFSELGGLARAMPWTFVSTLVAALGISGVPPLNAFVSKWLIYQGILEWGGSLFPLFLAIAMFGSALTLASFMKLMYAMFWGDRPGDLETVSESKPPILIPIVFLALAALGFGIFYFWPVQVLQPLFGQTAQATIPGIWQSQLATILLILSLLAGVPIYLLGRPKQSREVEVFVGGEAIDPELLRVRGTHFYGPIKQFRGLKQLYDLGERGAFDLYNQGTYALFWAARVIYQYVDQALGEFYQEVIPSLIALIGQILRLLNERLLLTYLMWIVYIGSVIGHALYPANENMTAWIRIVACFGMVGWAAMAWIERDLFRLLILAATSQAGFVILGATLSPDVALSYLATGGTALVVLFLCYVWIKRATKTSEIRQLQGLAGRMPIIFIIFLIAALWMSGLPPFGTFFSKYLLGVAAGEISPALTIVITGTALLTLGYLLRPIRRFLRPAQT